MTRWLVAALWVSSLSAGCSNIARGSQNQAAASRQDDLGRELAPLPQHTFGDEATGFVATSESTETPTIGETDGLVRVTIPLGTAEPVRCFVYNKPLNLAQTLRMFVNHVAESVDHHGIDHIDAGEVGGTPYIAVHTSYVAKPTGPASKPMAMGQLKYFAARGESNTTVCMHDEAGYNQTFDRVVKRFIATQKFVEGRSDPAAKLLVLRDVAVARAGSATVGVVEHRLYEGEAGYAYAVATSVLLAGNDGRVLASDEVDNQFSDTQGGIVEATYIKILNDSVAFNMGLHYKKGVGYHIDGMHHGQDVSIDLATATELPDFASQTALLRHLFASAQAGNSAHWTGFSPEDPSKFVSLDFVKAATDAQEPGHKRGVLTANGKPSALEVDNLGTPTQATTDEITVQRVWLAKGDHR